MRRVLVAVLALAVGVGAGGARAQGGPPGVLQVAIIGDVTLNPFTLPQQLPTLLVAKVVFSTLTRYQPGDLRARGRPRRVLAGDGRTGASGSSSSARACAGTTASRSPPPTSSSPSRPS